MMVLDHYSKHKFTRTLIGLVYLCIYGEELPNVQKPKGEKNEQKCE